MKILVTGGAGFIGSHVIDGLINAVHDVIIIDNLESGNIQNVNKKAQFYNANITDFANLKEIFEKEKPDIVNHQAAQISVSKSVIAPQVDAQTNIIGTLNLLELSVKNNIKKFVYANSGGAGYGEPLYTPMKEEHPIAPLSPYGISKHTAEHYLFLYNQLYNLKFISLRYSNVYGPRQDPYGEAGVVAIFTEKLLKGERPTIFGDGTQIRDYVYVKDIVDANLIALNESKAENQAFNVCTGRPTTTQEIFENLNNLIGANLTPIYGSERKGDLKISLLDPSKLQGVGWKITYNLTQGLKETVDYFKEIIER